MGLTKKLTGHCCYALSFFVIAAIVLWPHSAIAATGLAGICPGGTYTPFDYNGVVTPILAPIDSASKTLFTNTGVFAQYLFKLLGTVELIWFIAHTLFFKREIHDLLHAFAFKLVSLMFLMAVIIGLSQGGGTAVKNLVFVGFGSIGQGVGEGFAAAQNTTYSGINSSGAPGAQAESESITNILQEGDCATYAIVSWPAEQWNKGIFNGLQGNVIQKLWGAANLALSTVELIAALPGIILGFCIACVVGLTYLYLAGLMLMAIIDGLITLGVGMLLLGFAGSRWTSAMADNYTKLIFHTGFKVLAINLVAGLGMGMIGQALDTAINNFTASANNLSGLTSPSLPFGTLIGLLVVSTLVAFLAKNVNGIANTLAGSPSINLGGQIATAAGAAVGVAAAAATGGVMGAQALATAARAGGTMTQGSAKVANAIVNGKAVPGASEPPPALPGSATNVGRPATQTPAAALVGSSNLSLPGNSGNSTKSNTQDQPADTSKKPPAPSYVGNLAEDDEDDEGAGAVDTPAVLAPVAAGVAASEARSMGRATSPEAPPSRGAADIANITPSRTVSNNGNGATRTPSSGNGNGTSRGGGPSGDIPAQTLETADDIAASAGRGGETPSPRNSSDSQSDGAATNGSSTSGSQNNGASGSNSGGRKNVTAAQQSAFEQRAAAAGAAAQKMTPAAREAAYLDFMAEEMERPDSPYSRAAGSQNNGTQSGNADTKAANQSADTGNGAPTGGDRSTNRNAETPTPGNGAGNASNPKNTSRPGSASSPPPQMNAKTLAAAIGKGAAAGVRDHFGLGGSGDDDGADEDGDSSDLTRPAMDARMKRLRGITSSIKSSLQQHHRHSAVPPAPSIKH